MRSLLLLATLISTPALAAGTDRTAFTAPSAAKGAREIDIAWASDGTIVAVWLEGADKLTVATTKDRGATWKTLYRSSRLFTHVGGLSVTLGRSGTGAPSAKMVYIGLGLVQGHQDASGSWVADYEYVALVSGPWDTSWRGPMLAVPFVASDDSNGDGLFDGPADFDSPRVQAIVLTDPSDSKIQEPAIVWGDEGDIWVSVSHDFGRNLDDAAIITSGRDYPRDAGQWYENPSAAWDVKNRQILVAFEEAAQGDVLQGAAAVQSPGNKSSVQELAAGFRSDQNGPNSRFDAYGPSIAVNDGYANLSFARLAAMGSHVENWDLTAGIGQQLTSSGFDVRSAPDIAISSDKLVVTWLQPADNMPNSALAVHRSEQPRLVFYGGDDPANQSGGRISDGTLDPSLAGAPKVAIPPSGENRAYAWTTVDGGMLAGSGGDAKLDSD